MDGKIIQEISTADIGNVNMMVAEDLTIPANQSLTISVPFAPKMLFTTRGSATYICLKPYLWNDLSLAVTWEENGLTLKSQKKDVGALLPLVYILG